MSNAPIYPFPTGMDALLIQHNPVSLLDITLTKGFQSSLLRIWSVASRNPDTFGQGLHQVNKRNQTLE